MSMRTRSRFALSVLLAVVMTIGPVPAPALADVVDETIAQGNAATPTEGGGGKTDEKAEATDKDTGAPQKADDGGDSALAPKLQVAAEKVRVEAPAAAEGLAYDGSEQNGVEAGEGYSLTGDFKATDAGEYTATATPADGYEWADGTAGPKTIAWSIARRPVTVTADDKSKLAGEADPELTAKVEGTVGDDTVSFTLARAEGDEPGEYAITPTGEAEQGNYAVTFVAGKLTGPARQCQRALRASTSASTRATPSFG